MLLPHAMCRILLPALACCLFASPTPSARGENEPLEALLSARETARAAPTDQAREEGLAKLAALCDAWPTWALAQLELAELLMQGPLEGAQRERAGRAIEAAVQAEPENPRASRLEGRWRELTGQSERAIAAWQRLRTLRPRELEAAEQLGVLQAQAGRDAEALASLLAAVELGSRAPAVRANLAELLEQGGRREEAEAQLKALVRENPASAIFKRRLAAFYERAGEEAKAKAILDSIAPAKRKMRPLPPSKR